MVDMFRLDSAKKRLEKSDTVEVDSQRTCWTYPSPVFANCFCVTAHIFLIKKNPSERWQHHIDRLPTLSMFCTCASHNCILSSRGQQPVSHHGKVNKTILLVCSRWLLKCPSLQTCRLGIRIIGGFV